MMYGNTTLSTALSQRGLWTKKSDDVKQGRILIQGDREVGLMTAHVGWCLIRLLDGVSTDDYLRADVQEARMLLAKIDRTEGP